MHQRVAMIVFNIAERTDSCRRSSTIIKLVYILTPVLSIMGGQFSGGGQDILLYDRLKTPERMITRRGESAKRQATSGFTEITKRVFPDQFARVFTECF